MATRKTSQAENEEFMHALYKGGELLAAGKVIEAKDFLEKAFKLQPKNEKGQNLLGLTYFKLGLFDRASEIYEALVRENPADATLRVNLGLVYLKANLLPRAIREFETATDLQPEHQKAQNYLGVALAQAGEFARAKEHFQLAGSTAMVEKMERALKGEKVMKKPAEEQPAKQPGFAEIEGSEVVAERGGQVPHEAPPAEAQTEAQAEVVEVEVQPPPPAPVHPVAESDWSSHFPGEASQQADAEGDAFSEASMSAAPAQQPEAQLAQMEEVELTHSDAEPPPHMEHTPVPEAYPPPEVVAATKPDHSQDGAQILDIQAGRGATAAKVRPNERPQQHAAVATEAVDGALQLPIAELAPTLQLFPPPLTGPFTVREELAAIAVEDELLTRLYGLVSVAGKLEFKPETKRFRGKATDKHFGEGDQRVVRAKGKGLLIVDTAKRRFVSVELADESGYFQEDQVFAFEEALAFENGRVPSDIPPDLDLVHLRGKGRVLLAISGPLRSLEVTMDRPVLVPMANLVGWYGNLTPKVVPLLPDQKGKSSRAAVELSGEGFALIAVPMR